MSPLLAVKLGVLLLALVLAGGYGYRHGAQSVQARWDKAAAEAQAAAEARREADQMRARAAAISYEAQRAVIARRATFPSPESRYALHATICPPAGPLSRPLELGDVPVPAAVLQRLRDAGADETSSR